MRAFWPLLFALGCSEPQRTHPATVFPPVASEPADRPDAAAEVALDAAADVVVDLPAPATRVGTLEWLAAFPFRDAERSVTVGKTSYGLGELDSPCVGVGPGGEVFVATPHRGSLDLGGGALVNKGATGIAVAKLAPDGHHVWSHTYADRRSLAQAIQAAHGPPTGPTLAALIATPDGGARLFAQTSPQLNPGRHVPRRLGIDKRWSFELGLDASGATLHARELAGTWAFLRGAARTGDDWLIVGTILLPSPGPLPYPGYLEYDGRVSRETGGVARWTWDVGGLQGQDVDSVAVDGEGNVIVVGSAYGGAQIDGKWHSGSGYDVVVAKLRPDGTTIWARVFDGPGAQNATNVAVDAAGNIVLIAMLQDGSVDFGGGDATAVGTRDALVVKLSPAGEHVFTRRLGKRGYVDLRGVAVDAKGEIALVGHVQAGAVALGDVVVETRPDAGDYDAFAMKMSSAGDVVWARAFGGPGAQRATGVAIDPTGNVIVVGYANAGVRSGDRVVSEVDPAMFVAKLAR